MIKDILVNLAVESKHAAAAGYAVAMAAALDARLTGVAFAYEPVEIGVLEDASAAAIATFQQQTETAAHAAIAQFNATASGARLSPETHIVSASTAGAADIFGRMARTHDLSIVGQTEPEGSGADDLIMEAALFASGRPVLVVPYIQKGPFKIDRVLMCWDGSRNAARAIADAMPLLRHAKIVDVVTVAASDKPTEMPGADIAQHLARHGLPVETKQIVAPGADVANTILSYVADSSADLVVMGGYGHSRLREFVLGGTTRSMLSAMTVPALMAH